MDVQEKICAKLLRICEKDVGKPRKTITVLGAGMAGLVAAFELTKLGHKVVIYEASNRVGGRVWTHKFDDGQYHELGAMRFPASHDRTRHYASHVCKLKFRKFINHHDNKNGLYYIKDKLSFHYDFDIKLLPYLNLAKEDLALINEGPIKDQPGKLLNLFVDPLKKLVEKTRAVPEDMKALFAEGPMTPRIRELDKVSLFDFVKSHLRSQDAIDLVAAITGLDGLWDRAITMFLRDELVGTGDGLEEIVGGSSELPNALFNKLREQNVDIFFDHEIISINKQKNNIQLGIKSDKGTKLVDSEVVLCTIPFPVLRRMQLTGLSDAKMKAIRNLSYASSTKVLLNCNKRFWETSTHPIIGGGSQTDLITRNTHYPSDNYRSSNVKAFDNNERITKGVLTAFEISSEPVEVLDEEVSKGPGVLLASYNWGSDAVKLGSLKRSERVAVAIECLSHMHPEIKNPGMIKDSASMFWDDYKWAGAAFCFLRPGDFIEYYEDTIKPEGNLYFAGEHCSVDQAWIQGAIISSLRSVEQIVESVQKASIHKFPSESIEVKRIQEMN